MSKDLFPSEEHSNQNRQKLIDLLRDSNGSNSEYIFQDEWTKISETPIPSLVPPSQHSMEDFEQQKQWLLHHLSTPQENIDFQYLTPFAEHLLHQKETISQVDILKQIISFLRLPQHQWNQPQQTHLCYAVWSKANFQLLAFSNSFCSMHQLTKEYLQDHAFHVYDFAPVPEAQHIIKAALYDMTSCNIFYFQTTQPCRSGKFVTNRNYFLPNSLFIVSFYEKCEYYSDCMVVDGLKFEPNFITTQTSNLPFEKIIEYKFGKLRQILKQYNTQQTKEEEMLYTKKITRKCSHWKTMPCIANNDSFKQ